MKKITPFTFSFFTVLTTFQGIAQNKDSSIATAIQYDSARPAINWNSQPVKRVFPYKSFLVPSVMVVYGITSLHNGSLIELNAKVKEEIYTEPRPKRVYFDNYLQFAPAIAVYGLNAMGIKGKNNFRDRTMLYGLSELIMASTVFTVKKISGETRPDGSDNYSFPSGHTASAFAAAEFMRLEYKDLSPWYGVAGYAMAATTGYLRMTNNKHWLSDVVAGAGVGILSTKLAYWIYPVIKRKLFNDKEVHTMIMPVYQDHSLGLGLIHHF